MFSPQLLACNRLQKLNSRVNGTAQESCSVFDKRATWQAGAFLCAWIRLRMRHNIFWPAWGHGMLVSLLLLVPELTIFVEDQVAISLSGVPAAAR
jgi:hypothetical protein